MNRIRIALEIIFAYVTKLSSFLDWLGTGFSIKARFLGLNNFEQIIFAKIAQLSAFVKKLISIVTTIYFRYRILASMCKSVLVCGAITSAGLAGFAYFFFDPVIYSDLAELVYSRVVRLKCIGLGSITEFVRLYIKGLICFFGNLTEFVFSNIKEFLDSLFNSQVPDSQVSGFQPPNIEVTQAEVERAVAAYKDCISQEVNYNSDLEAIKKIVNHCSLKVFSSK